MPNHYHNFRNSIWEHLVFHLFFMLSSWTKKCRILDHFQLNSNRFHTQQSTSCHTSFYFFLPKIPRVGCKCEDKSWKVIYRGTLGKGIKLELIWNFSFFLPAKTSCFHRNNHFLECSSPKYLSKMHSSSVKFCPQG